MGDDGEKFGAWPTTYEHCWGSGRWMEQFFGALEENSGWLTTTTPSDWADAHPPIGRVYIPTGSYTEMTAWALPPKDTLAFEHALAVATAEGRPEARFLRGGFWRNFQRRYREINDLHKQMLRTSAKVAAMPEGAPKLAARDHLYQGQSNDCYWHGLFGGIYISHMRLATFEHLIAAEDIADRLANGTGSEAVSSRLADIDIDGVPEVLFESPGQVVVIKPSEGAAVGSWDVRGPRHALAAVLRRRPESYHERLRTAAAAGKLKVETTTEIHAAEASSAGAPGPAQAAEPSAVESIHELVQAKEPGLENLLIYDAYERRSGLVHLFDGTVTLADIRDARAQERADILDEPYEIAELGPDRLVAHRDAVAHLEGPGDRDGQNIRVSKTYQLQGDRRAPALSLGVRLENRSDRRLKGRLVVEWNITLSAAAAIRPRSTRWTASASRMTAVASWRREAASSAGTAISA